MHGGIRATQHLESNYAMIRRILLVLGVLLVASSTVSGELGKINRTIKKEPNYSGTPKYALVVFGPNAADRLWLVQDGSVLYVDRNGNGDLTEEGERVAVKTEKDRDVAEAGFSFEAGDLKLGGRVHKRLSVYFRRLSRFTSLKDNAHVRRALKADPDASAAIVSVDVESTRLKGGGIGGRLSQMAGFYDPAGVLQFAGKPADAPLIHFDGPWQISVYGEIPTLTLGRDNELVLVVGTPGLGGGTFAMLAYEEAIPENVHPKVQVRFPANGVGEPVSQDYELKKRC
jgi:hypothetical protein